MKTLSRGEIIKIYDELIKYKDIVEQSGGNIYTPEFQQLYNTINGVQREYITQEKGEELKKIQEMLYRREITGVIETYNRMITQGKRRILGRKYS